MKRLEDETKECLQARERQDCSVTLPYIFFFFSSLPLSSFPLRLFHISFSVSFSSHISPLSFRLLALFFLYIPFLVFALSLVCFHSTPPISHSLFSLPSSPFIVAFPSPRLPLFLRLLLILILCPIFLVNPFLLLASLFLLSCSQSQLFNVFFLPV